MQKAAVPCAENAVVFRPLVLDLGEFLEDRFDGVLLLYHLWQGKARQGKSRPAKANEQQQRKGMAGQRQGPSKGRARARQGKGNNKGKERASQEQGQETHGAGIAHAVR